MIIEFFPSAKKSFFWNGSDCSQCQMPNAKWECDLHFWMKSTRIFFQKGNYLTYYGTTVKLYRRGPDTKFTPPPPPTHRSGNRDYRGSSPNGQSRNWTALLTDTFAKSRFLNSHTNAVYLHSHKRSGPVTNTFSSSRGCPLMRASTAPRRCLGNYVQTCLFCDPSMTNFSTIFASCLYRSTIGVRLSLWRKANGRSKAISAVYLQVIINYQFSIEWGSAKYRYLVVAADAVNREIRDLRNTE